MMGGTFTGHWRNSKQGHLLDSPYDVVCVGMPLLQAVTFPCSNVNLLVVLLLLCFVVVPELVLTVLNDVCWFGTKRRGRCQGCTLCFCLIQIPASCVMLSESVG